MRSIVPAYFSYLLVAALVLTGCASLGLEPAKSFDENLAYTVSQNAAARQAAANAFDAGSIDLADAQFALKTTDNAREFLDAAKVASGAGDIKTAEGKIALAKTVLTELQSYLRTRSKK